MTRTSCIRWDDNDDVLDQQLSWSFITSVKLTAVTVHGWTCRSTRTHYLDSEPTCLWPYSL